MFKIGNVEVNELVERFNTPLYVYDENKIIDSIREYKKGLQSSKYETLVIYASKAFACLHMYKIAKQENIGVDVVSGGELYGAMKVGVDPNKIFFHGNNKTEDEMDLALNYKVKNIMVDNLDELKIWLKKAEKIDYKLDIMFRINVGVSAHTHAYVITSHPDSKFGFYIESKDIHEGIEMIKKAKNVEFMGFHSHIGSQIFDMQGFMIAIEKIFDLIKKEKIQPRYLNLGGGAGVRYTDEDKPLALEEFAKEIIDKVDSELCKNNLTIEKLFIEPGRSLVAEAGYTLYTINKTKKALHKTYYFIDGGMADNIRPALYQAKYACDVANKMEEPKINKVSIAGKCCESGDVIIEDVMLPSVVENDILVVYSTGAYGYSMSSNYNKLPRPAIVFVKGNEAKLAVRRETYENLYVNDVEGE